MPHALRRRRIVLAPPVPAAPAGDDPTAWPALKIWLEADAANVKTEEDGTGTVSNGGQVGYIAGLGGTPNFVQATEANRPTWSSANQSLIGGSTLRLAAASGFTWTGPLTIYVVGRRTTSTLWVPLSAAAADASTVMIYSDNNSYIAPTSGTRSVAYTGSSGLILVRWRRTSSNTWKLAATGMSEADLVTGDLGGNFLAQTIIGRPSSGEWSHESAEFNCWVAGDGDAVADGYDTTIRDYLVAKYSVTDLS